MIDQLLDNIAPHSCCGCGNLGSILCPQCKNDIISEPFEDCLLCLRPTSVNNLCMRCRGAGIFDDAWCVGVRELQLKSLLDRYKFDSARQAGYVAAELLHARLPLLPSDTVVVPVPTSSAHRRVRGFDHTAIIAKRLASLRRLAVATVLSTSSNETQHFKSKTDREKSAWLNIIVDKSPARRVLLVDDIYTTGATVRACARQLRDYGTENLLLAIIARQTLDGSHDL